jgi:hypothetical protein
MSEELHDDEELLLVDAWRILESLHQATLARFSQKELTSKRSRQPKRLLRYGFKVYSQCDEDGILQEIFRRIGVRHRTFIEIGVQHGIECNTTKLLLEQWTGLWLECDRAQVEKARTLFKADIDAGRLRIGEDRVTVENVEALFGDHDMEGEIDLLSIDIDGNDYWVWKAVESVRPRVVVIEYNATLRPPLSLVIPYDAEFRWRNDSYFGASLKALEKLGTDKGYRLVGCTLSGVNAFFVRDDLCSAHFHSPYTAEEHYEPPRYFLAFTRAGHQPGFGPYVNV